MMPLARSTSFALLLAPLLGAPLLCTPLLLGQQLPAKPSAAIPARNIAIHFDPASTQIHFTVSSLLRDVRGTFQFKGGALAIDPDSTLAQGELLVDATSGHTGSTAEDKQMQQEVLESGRYPSIFFHAEHLRGQIPKEDGASDVIAEGTLNIHGADHPLLMKVHLVRQGHSVTATTRFTVPYVEWGMKEARGSFFHLSKTVQVDLTARGTLRTVATINGVQSNESDQEGPS